MTKQESQTIPGRTKDAKSPKIIYEKEQYYYHPDHLGSSSFVTDEKGKVYEHLEYFPFGETWAHEHSNTQVTPYRFTGKEYDETTGLYYYGARYYDPRTSVWQSPDPILWEYMSGQTNGGVFNPKNLNMFGYTYNNPVNLVDPDGNNPKFFGDFALNLAIAYAIEGKLTWFTVRGAAADTVKDAFNPMATVNKAKKLANIAKFGIGEYKQLKV